MMMYLSVLLFGLATGLLIYLYLANKQRQTQRLGVRKRFSLEAPAQSGKPPGLRVPFLGSIMKKREAERRSHRIEAELPRMLDILAMGMHAGLSFDAAFGLYVERFDTELARLCRERFEVWGRGLISRSDGLEQLAGKVDIPIFDRFCRTASRSLRHGIPMAPLIKEYANQARKEYRNKQQEQVLKAPVKMLLPTGALILPAMMMLVIGPIILDVTGRMV